MCAYTAFMYECFPTCVLCMYAMYVFIFSTHGWTDREGNRKERRKERKINKERKVTRTQVGQEEVGG